MFFPQFIDDVSVVDYKPQNIYGAGDIRVERRIFCFFDGVNDAIAVSARGDPDDLHTIPPHEDAGQCHLFM